MKIICLIFIILFLLPAYSSAYTSGCLMNLHKQALMDAINAMPTDAKKILKRYEKNMKMEVNKVHGTPAAKRRNYDFLHKEIITIIADNKRSRHEYMSRALVDLTTYIFDKHNPQRSFDLCDDKKLMKKAFVVYDGFDNKPDYSSSSNLNFSGKTKYRIVRVEDKLLVFYNELVNETLDQWMSIWIEAGGALNGLPKKSSYIRGTKRNIQALNARLNNNDFDSFNSKIQLLKARVLYNYNTSGSSGPSRSS